MLGALIGDMVGSVTSASRLKLLPKPGSACRRICATSSRRYIKPSAASGPMTKANQQRDHHEKKQSKDIAPLLRRTWNRELLEMYRPHHAHPNKALLFDLAFDEGSAPPAR
jgi:hypothetical protein